MIDVFTCIHNGMPSFNESEKKMANYILKNWQDIIYMSTQEFASKCSVSDATVIRFCRKIRLTGFKELKIVLSMQVQNKENIDLNSNIHEQISISDSPKEIFEKITFGNIKALYDTAELIDFDVLAEAIDKINNANKIFLAGVGGSSNVVLDLYYKLLRINMPVVYHEEYDKQLVSAAMIKEGDVVIAITNFGKTKEVNNIAKYAKEKGATVITITQFGSPPIAKYSDILLFTSTTENNMRVGAMASRIAQLNIIDSLFIGIISKRYSEVQHYLKITKEIMKMKD